MGLDLVLNEVAAQGGRVVGFVGGGRDDGQIRVAGGRQRGSGEVCPQWSGFWAGDYRDGGNHHLSGREIAGQSGQDQKDRGRGADRKSTRLNSSHGSISYAVSLDR